MTRPQASTAESFWALVEQGPACWVWRGRQRDGVGLTTHNGYAEHAHRVAYELAHGVMLDERRQVRRRCGNPLCVAPAHLRLVPTRETIRATHRPGDKHETTARRLGVRRETVTRALGNGGERKSSR